jgi:hypothetical protein
MARIRTIKPEYQSHPPIGRLSRDARLLLLLLLPQADDAGRLRDLPRVMVGTLYPYDDDAQAKFADWMGELEREHLIVRYTAADQHYIQIAGWLDDLGPVGQRINRPSAVHLPGLDPAPAPTNIHGGLTEPPVSRHGALTPVPVPVPSTKDLEGEGEADSGKAPESADAPPVIISPETRWNKRGLMKPVNAPVPLSDEAQMIATAVIQAIGVTTDWARDQIAKQAEQELKAYPGDLDGILNGMVKAWKEYCRCDAKGKLSKPSCGPEKFYGEGRWRSPKLWGLKMGMRAYA